MDEDDYRGRWYAAEVAEVVPASDGVKVRYDELLEDDGETHLVETLAHWQLRPEPPRQTAPERKAWVEKLTGGHPAVDVYFEDAWWPAAVTECQLSSTARPAEAAPPAAATSAVVAEAPTRVQRVSVKGPLLGVQPVRMTTPVR